MREIKFEYVVKSGDMVKLSRSYTLEEIEDLGFPDELLEGLDECVMMCHSDNNCDCDTPFYSEGEIIARRQYTGIKDINKKEVYDGDIVSYLYKSWNTAGIGDETRQGKIVFHDGSFQIARLGDRLKIVMDMRGKDLLEVIGNIYENPELLKV